MAYTTINKPSDYFNTKLYTGNGSTNAITGVGFQPDFVWLKGRTGTAYYHQLFDAIRGTTKALYTPVTNAEDTSSGLTAFGSDGFTVGSSPTVNGNNIPTVSWNWKANGAGSANTDGATASTVSVNTTAGFSIVKYTGAGATTYGHGLGVVPNMIIIKKLNSADDWFVYHHTLLTPSATQKQFILLNSTSAFASNGSATTFTSVSNSTFGVGTDDKISESGDSFIAYCFAEKQGYSKFGSYVGNGNADGTFVYTGFKPAFLLYKNSTAGATNWQIHDSKRSPYNLSVNRLNPNDSSAELGTTADSFDFLSNGFKARATASNSNTSGATYIYMAFAEAPLVGTNGVTAKAR